MTKPGDIVRLKNVRKGTDMLGIVVAIEIDKKLSNGGPIKFYKIMWSSGLVGNVSEYFCKSVKNFEVVCES